MPVLAWMPVSEPPPVVWLRVVAYVPACVRGWIGRCRSLVAGQNVMLRMFWHTQQHRFARITTPTSLTPAACQLAGTSSTVSVAGWPGLAVPVWCGLRDIQHTGVSASHWFRPGVGWGGETAAPARCRMRNHAESRKIMGCPYTEQSTRGLGYSQAEMGFSSDRMNVNRAMPAHGRRSSRA